MPSLYVTWEWKHIPKYCSVLNTTQQTASRYSVILRYCAMVFIKQQFVIYIYIYIYIYIHTHTHSKLRAKVTHNHYVSLWHCQRKMWMSLHLPPWVQHVTDVTVRHQILKLYNTVRKTESLPLPSAFSMYLGFGTGAFVGVLCSRRLPIWRRVTEA